jgi:hypothetical protein
VKTSTTIALALATLLAGPVAAHAQTSEPSPYHHYQVHRYQGPHHTVHHRFVAHNPARAPAPVVVAPAAQAAPFGLSWPHIAPYPDGKGDEDGLSEAQTTATKAASTAIRRIDGSRARAPLRAFSPGQKRMRMPTVGS